MPLALVPLVMVAMNGVYAAAAYPFGKLADRMAHTRLLRGAGRVDCRRPGARRQQPLDRPWQAWRCGRAHGHDVGLLAAMVADVAPADLRGTAFGFFNLMSGLACCWPA